MNIGKMQEVDVRKLWKHEQKDFSAWLAKPENLEYLNDILGLTLLEAKNEVYVGSYRCDLVAQDETSGTTVIIENQLEATNHDHLGKIITYASGLSAEVVVWIVKVAKEEHRAAIEWLNNNTNEGINFFLIEIHAYSINGSEPAPKFEVIEKPNNFVKRGKTKNKDGEVFGKTKSDRLAFWEKFNEVVLERGKPFNIRKPSTDHWYDVAIGSSEAHIAISLIKKDSKIIVELYITNNKELYDELYDNKNKIEKELGYSLEWDRLDKKAASRIKYYIDDFSFENQTNYPKLMNEIIDVAIKMKKVFKKYIK